MAKPGEWSNLPDGEVFTCPEEVNGTVVAWVAGDHFSQKYGVFKKPLKITMENSRVTEVVGENKKLVGEFKSYIKKHANGDRVGEFAIGALLGLKELTGNLLQDEKYPWVHMAFGGTYPKETGASWDCQSHVDVIPLRVSIWVDGKMIMRNGKFTIKGLGK